MRSAFVALLFAIAAAVRADYVVVKPQSYSVDFAAAALPSGTVVMSLSLEVGTSDDIFIRKLPHGWIAGTRSGGSRKTTVYLARSNWVDGTGDDLPIVALSGAVWIRAELDDQDRPTTPPVVKAFVEIAPASGEKYVKRVELSPQSFRLTYVP